MNILPTRIGIFLAATLFSIGLTSAHAGDVRVGVSIHGEIAPGVYGRVNIGDAPRTVLVNPQPVIIEQTSRYYPSPIYLHVPHGHSKDWRKHCWRYNACNQHVYFVRSREYESNYRPHSHYENRERRYEKHHNRDRDRRDYRDYRDSRDYERHNDRDHDNGHRHNKHNRN